MPRTARWPLVDVLATSLLIGFVGTVAWMWRRAAIDMGHAAAPVAASAPPVTGRSGPTPSRPVTPGPARAAPIRPTTPPRSVRSATRRSPSAIDTVLVDVADRGDADAVRALLAGADKAALSGSGARALSRAAFRGHTEVVRLLLDAGASPTAAADTTEHNTPLHDAATAGRVDAARLLLRAGAKADARSDTIGTPLAYAAHYGGGRDMIRLLHEAGADVNAAARDGLTPLHCAVLTRHLAEAEALLELGANVDAVYGTNTPLTVAASRGDVAMARLLLDRGAAANVRGPQGRTPLALAAYHGREAVVRLLLSRGADPTTPDASGLTPLELARQFKHLETQAILEEATGARPARHAVPGQTGDGDRPASPNGAIPTSTSASPRP